MRKNLFRRILNRILHIMARFSPGATNIRPFLHRIRGVKIQGNVFIGDDVYIENEYPECVEIHDEAVIGLRSTIIAHFRGSGKIIIGKKVCIGAQCLISASPNEVLSIGGGAVLAAGAVVTRSVPPSMLMAGVPAKPIAKVTIPATLSTSYEDFKKGLIPIK